MRSKTTSLKIPNILADAAKRRAKSLGYPSFNAYAISLIVYDLMVRKEHPITKAFAELDLDKQDRIFQELADLEEKGKGVRGSFLEHLLHKAAEDSGVNAEKLIKGMTEQLERYD